MAKKVNLPVFAVKRIKDIFFVINEDVIQANRKVKFQLTQNLGANEQTDLVSLIFHVKIHYETDEAVKAPLAEIKVQNIFHIQDIKQYLIKDALEIPRETLISMVSVSVAHTRALLAKNLAGTPIEDIMMPVVNPVALTDNIFPSTLRKTGEKKQIIKQ